MGSTPVIRLGPAGTQFLTLATAPGNVRNVSCPVDQEIRKLPPSQISQSMTGYPPIAVAAGPNPHRQLWLSNDGRPSTSVHRRLQRRELPSQQSVPVTKPSLTGRDLTGRSGSPAYIRCRDIEGPLTGTEMPKSRPPLTLPVRLSPSQYCKILLTPSDFVAL